MPTSTSAHTLKTVAWSSAPLPPTPTASPSWVNSTTGRSSPWNNCIRAAFGWAFPLTQSRDRCTSWWSTAGMDGWSTAIPSVLAWKCARPNAIVTVVALYDAPQVLPLPEMYGKNLTFKTGGVDGCDCAEILSLIEQGKIDTTPLITHRFALRDIEEAYRIFENKLDGVIKIAIKP